jgi:hypothetical protein
LTKPYVREAFHSVCRLPHRGIDQPTWMLSGWLELKIREFLLHVFVNVKLHFADDAIRRVN